MNRSHCTRCGKIESLRTVSWALEHEAMAIGSRPESQAWWHIHDNRLCSHCYEMFLYYPFHEHAKELGLLK